MGMFDTITGLPDELEECPDCGTGLWWQSKDGDCTCSGIHFTDTDYFYTQCTKCNVWLEYNLNKLRDDIPGGFLSIDDYTLTKSKNYNGKKKRK